MDEELLELQKQFEFAQQAKSSIRLSERNVVELVQKLHELQIIDFDLLHTVSGKEYITPEQLRLEILAEVKRLGRVSLIDLTDNIGVDLYHVERQTQVVVADDPGLMLIQGEIISNSYWDMMAEEINERLQECSQIAVAELAAQLQVGSELISSMLELRLGTLIKGRLEGGQLYTPAYVARINAMVRGAARGITVPINLSALWSSLQQLLQGINGATGVAVDNPFFQTLFNGLVKEVEILGSLRAGVHWTPDVFASAQKEFVDSFLSQDVFTRLDKEMQTSIPLSAAGLGDEKHSTKESKGGNGSGRLSELNETTESGNRLGMERGSKKKKGKSAGNSRSSTTESDIDNQEHAPSKSKKNQRKGKDSSASHVSESKSSKGVAVPSEEWVINKILVLVPEFEEHDFLKPLAIHLRPMLVNSWNERRKAMLAENSDRMKRVFDNLQKKLDESGLNLQLYEKALDLFEDDQATLVVLQRHLLRTTGASIVDMLLFNLDVYNKLKNGIPVEETQSSESASLSSSERNSLAKSLHGSLAVKAVALVESLEGKRVDTFMTALSALVEESGLFLKKLDKKLEKTLMHSYRKDLTSQVSTETDPVSLLPKVVSLLYLKIHNKALQAPGRAISNAVSRLKDKLDDSAFKTLMDYHSGTVTLLALMSASTNDDDDCSSDRITTKKELLESLMPTLKGLVLGTSPPQDAS
ncbi:E3 UFM1-protein ligase 1-like protein [Bienertia sinuspersici]